MEGQYECLFQSAVGGPESYPKDSEPLNYNVTGVLMTAVGISSLKEGGTRSSNSFQNTNNIKGLFPWVLRCCLQLRMSATGPVLIELCQVSTNSSLSSLACLAFLCRLTIEY